VLNLQTTSQNESSKRKNDCYFRIESRSVLFVQLYYDFQANQNVLFVVDLEESQHQRENGLDVRSQQVVGWQTVQHLEYQLAHLLYVVLGYEVRFTLLQYLQENLHRMV
jgi:hypothetical protein